MATIPTPIVPPETAIPADLVLLREPEVLTLLKQLLETQQAILCLLQDRAAGRITLRTSIIP